MVKGSYNLNRQSYSLGLKSNRDKVQVLTVLGKTKSESGFFMELWVNECEVA